MGIIDAPIFYYDFKSEANDFYKMISRWEADLGDSHSTNQLAIPAGNEIAVVGRLYNKLCIKIHLNDKP